MKFIWDENKREENIYKHGLDFADAHRIFDGPVVEKQDTRFDYGETRWLAFGLLHGILCVALVYSEPDDETIRVISLRKANKHERETFYQQITN